MKKEKNTIYIQIYIYISDIVFLSKCKKFNIVPNGLRVKHPFNCQCTSVKNKGRNICVKAEQRLRNAAINDAYQKQRDIHAYTQTLKSSSPTNYQQITEFCESQYRRHTKELFQRKSKFFFNYVIIILS